jgi:hypothetical protein
MKKAHIQIDQQKFVLFWMGLLTGAVLVGLIFTYQAIESTNGGAAILKWYETQLDSTQLIGPDTGNLIGPDTGNLIGPDTGN